MEGRDIPIRAWITAAILPEEPEWNSSRFQIGTWPVLVMIEGKDDEEDAITIISGIVLKPCRNGSHQRLGVLQRTAMNLERNSDDRLQLRSDYGEGILECERRSIRLA